MSGAFETASLLAKALNVGHQHIYEYLHIRAWPHEVIGFLKADRCALNTSVIRRFRKISREHSSASLTRMVTSLCVPHTNALSIAMRMGLLELAFHMDTFSTNITGLYRPKAATLSEEIFDNEVLDSCVAYCNEHPMGQNPILRDLALHLLLGTNLPEEWATRVTHHEALSFGEGALEIQADVNRVADIWVNPTLRPISSALRNYGQVTPRVSSVILQLTQTYGDAAVIAAAQELDTKAKIPIMIAVKELHSILLQQASNATTMRKQPRREQAGNTV